MTGRAPHCLRVSSVTLRAWRAVSAEWPCLYDGTTVEEHATCAEPATTGRPRSGVFQMRDAGVHRPGRSATIVDELSH